MTIENIYNALTRILIHRVNQPNALTLRSTESVASDQQAEEE